MLALPILWSLHGLSMLVAVLWYVRKAALPSPLSRDARVQPASDTASAINTHA